MKVAIKTSLLAKRDMYVNSSQNQWSIFNYQRLDIRDRI